MKRSGAEPGRLTGRHLQEHSSNGTSASKDGTGLLGNSRASELVWAGLDWGASSVWDIAGGSVDGVDRGGGCNRVDWLNWDGRGSSDCDGACLSIGGAVGDRGSTGNNWLGWGAAGLLGAGAAGVHFVVRGGGLAAQHWLGWGAGAGWVVHAGGVLWVVDAGGLAAQHWLGGGAGAGWVVVGAGVGAGAGGGGGGRHWPPVIGRLSNGGSSNAGKGNWSETHLD